MHMACAVAEQPDEQDGRGVAAADNQVTEVTFLYQLTPGEWFCLLVSIQHSLRREAWAS